MTPAIVVPSTSWKIAKRDAQRRNPFDPAGLLQRDDPSDGDLSAAGDHPAVDNNGLLERGAEAIARLINVTGKASHEPNGHKVPAGMVSDGGTATFGDGGTTELRR